MMEKRQVWDKSTGSQQQHHACSRFLIFSEAMQFPCKIIQTWICNTLNSGYHLSGTAAGQQQTTRCMERPSQHSYSLVLLRHRGSTARAHSLHRPEESHFKQFQPLQKPSRHDCHFFYFERKSSSSLCFFTSSMSQYINLSTHNSCSLLSSLRLHL